MQRRWSDLSPAGKALIITGSAIEAVLTVAALTDLARRPAEQVRGRKWAWALGCFVQPLGPIAYFAVGRQAD